MANNNDFSVDDWAVKFNSNSNTANVPIGSGGPIPEGLNTGNPIGSIIDPATGQRSISGSKAIRDVKDNLHQFGMGMFAAPVNATAGLVGLSNPELADTIQQKVQDVRKFQEQNDIGGATQIPQGQRDAWYNSGQLATSLFTPVPAGKGVAGNVGSGALAGMLGGLGSRQIGDTEADTAKRIGVGALVGGTVAGIVPAIGAGLKASSNKVKSWFGKDVPGKNVLSEAQQEAVNTIDDAFRKEIRPEYKKLGISINKMTDEEKIANTLFIDEFKTKYANQVSDEYNKALDYVKAPDDVVKAFGLKDKEVMDAARDYLKTSKDFGAKEALKQPGSMRYYEELRQALVDMPNSGKANIRVSQELSDIMAQNSPEYLNARSLYRTKENFANNLGSNFYNSVRSDKTDKTLTLTKELMKTPEGADFVNKTFLDGMRSNLVVNSGYSPIQQLQKTLGRNPAEIENTLDFLRKTGQNDVADKFQALTSFTNVASNLGPKNQSVSAKMITKSLNEIDSKELGSAIIKLMGSNKWSDQFNKIMQEQGDHLIRTEKLSNLLLRMTKNKTKQAINTTIGASVGSTLQNSSTGSDY